MKGRKLFAFSRPSGEAAPALTSRGLQRRPSTKLSTEEKQPADGSNAELQQSNKCGLTKVPHPPQKKNFPPSAPGRPCSARGVLIQSLNLESRGGIGSFLKSFLHHPDVRS